MLRIARKTVVLILFIGHPARFNAIERCAILLTVVSLFVFRAKEDFIGVTGSAGLSHCANDKRGPCISRIYVGRRMVIHKALT